MPRFVDELFESISKADSETEFTVGVSYLEIYNEHICDLLERR
jgi:kinesin family protein 5